MIDGEDMRITLGMHRRRCAVIHNTIRKMDLVFGPGVGMVAVPRPPEISPALLDHVAAALYLQWAAGSSSQSKTWEAAHAGTKIEFLGIAGTAILAVARHVAVEGRPPFWLRLWRKVRP